MSKIVAPITISNFPSSWVTDDDRAPGRRGQVGSGKQTQLAKRAPGGYGFFSDTAGHFGLDFNGIAVAVPEPSIYVLLGVGILLCGQRFRRRKSA